MRRRGSSGLASLLGAGLVSAGLFFGSGCGREDDAQGFFSSFVKDEVSLSKVDDFACRVEVEVYSHPDLGPTSLSSSAKIFADDPAEIRRVSLSDSILYIVSSAPLSNLDARYKSVKGQYSFDVTSAESNRVIRIVRSKTKFKDIFNSKEVSVYAVRGSNPEMRSDSLDFVRSGGKGLGESLVMGYRSREFGIRVAAVADFGIKMSDGILKRAEFFGEGMIAPPYSQDIEGYWDCPSRGRFFFFDNERILSSDSFYSRGARIIKYENIYRKKDTIYLNARNLNGERIVISSKKNKTVLTYFPTDAGKDDGEVMERMSYDAARNKY